MCPICVPFSPWLAVRCTAPYSFPSPYLSFFTSSMVVQLELSLSVLTISTLGNLSVQPVAYWSLNTIYATFTWSTGLFLGSNQTSGTSFPTFTQSTFPSLHFITKSDNSEAEYPEPTLANDKNISLPEDLSATPNRKCDTLPPPLPLP